MRKLLPPHIALLLLGLELVLHRFVPLAAVVPASLRVGGYGLIALGVLVPLWAVRLFRRAHTGVVPFSPSTALVLAGPYRLTRNPMYLGMASVLVGVAVRLGSLTPFVAPVLFVGVITVRFIRP